MMGNKTCHFAEELLKVAFKMNVPKITTIAPRTTEGVVAKPLTKSVINRPPRSVVTGISIKAATNVPSAAGRVKGVKINPALKDTPPPSALSGGTLVS